MSGEAFRASVEEIHGKVERLDALIRVTDDFVFDNVLPSKDCPATAQDAALLLDTMQEQSAAVLHALADVLGEHQPSGEAAAQLRDWKDALFAYRTCRMLSDAAEEDASAAADLLTTAVIEARDRLVEHVPAPNASALAEKMRVAFEYSRPFEGLIGNWEAILIADAERLGASA